ncbi:MAG TPA: methyltransferase domain-containing protein [Anaerolineales bacterium]|nr:methyltransferase domain-containing protein [Anaerolineales bacterium]
MLNGWLILGFVVSVALLLAGWLFWQLMIAEGVFWGQKWVTRLYDANAHRYEAIKAYQPQFEEERIGEPLALALYGLKSPKVLDVACGTGRVGRALHAFSPQIPVFGVDASLAMLRWRETLQSLQIAPSSAQALAVQLPFGNQQFAAVTCMEAMEFMPSARAALREWVRVLAPAGVILLTHRIGWQARLASRDYLNREELTQALTELGLVAVVFQSWTTDYDLVWAHHAGD